MSDTVFCEQCGAAIRASASFCSSCGNAQTPTAVTPVPAPPLTSSRDVADEPSESASPAESLIPRLEPPPPEIPAGHGPSPRFPPGASPAPSPTGASKAVPRGRLNRALRKARRQDDSQVVASFWLGWTSITSVLIGVLAKSSALYFISVVTGIIAIVTARFARQRAQAADDVDLVYLSRYGQITGWIVVGLFIAVLLFIAVFFGSFLGSFGH
jgi:hypothetical protein